MYLTRGTQGNEPDPRLVYADIIDHPHHQSPARPHMSLYHRAAQFSAFDALAGYSDMVAEEARQTDQAAVLDEDAIARLNQKLRVIAHGIADGLHPEIAVVYFAPDRRKSGGAYVAYRGIVKKIDTIKRQIVFSEEETVEGNQIPGRAVRDKKTVKIETITEIHGELVDGLDDTVP